MPTVSLYGQVKLPGNLDKAWRHVRAAGFASLSQESQDAVRQFDERSRLGLRRIASRLADHRFEFQPEKGYTKSRKGKAPRPIAVGPVENRIVQRAILQVLQAQPIIQALVATSGSFGGIPKRGVRDAVARIRYEISVGCYHYIRSDIRDFFQNLPRRDALASVMSSFDDAEFAALLERATESNIANIDELGESIHYFPTKERGVAQGSPLSAFLANIILHRFDQIVNGRGITCVRYLDDFIFIGGHSSSLRKAFEVGQRELKSLNLSAYDPFSDHGGKGSSGAVDDGFEFLGCQFDRHLVQPSKAARNKLLERVDSCIKFGQTSLSRIARTNERGAASAYAQTLVHIDKVLRGWGHAFSFCNGRSCFDALDLEIDRRLSSFTRSWERMSAACSPTVRRRLLGVHLLSDTREDDQGSESNDRHAQHGAA